MDSARNIGHIFFPIWIFISFLTVTYSYNGMWWALGTITAVDPQQLQCSSIPGLSPHPQAVTFCDENKILLPSVADGARLGIYECQFQFETRRWNCSIVEGDESVFGNVLDKASREAAFVNAILSAGLVHSLSRACARGEYLDCNCDRRHRGPSGRGRDLDIQPNDTWRWGGCSEDVRFGVRFGRKFLNAQEDDVSARGLMNQHNNEAGRQVVLRNMELKCKCHGVSGSCELKTCWWQMASFRTMGDVLKVKYDSATEMVASTREEGLRTLKVFLKPLNENFKQPTERDLIYYEQSPSYCEYDPAVGSLGTTGRECNKTSRGIDGCELLCCGRGHNTQTVIREEKCECRFVWCCEVVCKKCRNEVDVHTCK